MKIKHTLQRALIILFIASTIPSISKAQIDTVWSEFGRFMPIEDTIRVLLVFAETSAGNADPNWPCGQLPLDADLYFDAEIAPGGPNNLYHNATNELAFVKN